MTYPEFLDKIQDYFGSYPDNPNVGGFVMAYLRRDIDASRLPKLFRYLTYSHPTNYGAPDIAAIEHAIKWARENDKGSDVHKSMADIEKTDLCGRLDTLTDEEQQEGERMLEEAGGMQGMLESAVHHVDPDDDVVRREPYVD